MVSGGPQLLTGVLIEGNDAGIGAADVDKKAIALDERRRGHAEEAGGHLIIRIERALPDFLAGL